MNRRRDCYSWFCDCGQVGPVTWGDYPVDCSCGRGRRSTRFHDRPDPTSKFQMSLFGGNPPTNPTQPSYKDPGRPKWWREQDVRLCQACNSYATPVGLKLEPTYCHWKDTQCHYANTKYCAVHSGHKEHPDV